MTRRIVRAFGRRLADADPDDLLLLLDVQEELDKAIAVAIGGMRKTGFSWSEIAAPMGVTKQAAQQRWGDMTCQE